MGSCDSIQLRSGHNIFVKMLKFVLVLLLYSNLCLNGLSTAQSVDTTETEELCSSYCFQAVNPFLQFAELCQTNQNQFFELQMKLKEKEFKIKSLENQITVKVQSETNTKKEEVINQYQELLKAKDNELLKYKEAEILDYKKQIIQLEQIIDSKNLELKSKKEEISVCKKQLKEQSDNLKFKEMELNSKNETIKIRDQKIIKLDSQIMEDKKNIDVLNKKLDSMEKELDSCIKSTENVKNDANCECNQKQDSCLSYANSTGIHSICVPGMGPFSVLCDSQLAGSGWTVIQRRMNGDVDFNGNWSMYKKGFGNLDNEFFIGLEKLHLITQSKPHELYIQLDVNDTRKFARYDEFLVGSEEEEYSLKSLGKFEGSAEDSFSYNIKAKFRTQDRDNALSCAETFGPWWYKIMCKESSLNGKFFKNGFDENLKGIHWGTWRKNKYGRNDYTVSMTFVQMMIRPKEQ